jgi:hypothetical protein
VSRWNPSSATNTIDGAYRFGCSDTRKRIADFIEEQTKLGVDVEEIVKRVRAGEYDPQ